MEYKFNREDRVLITLKDGTRYEGDVENFLQIQQLLTLHNVVQVPENIIMTGLRHFQGSEIRFLQVIRERIRSENESEDSDENSGDNMKMSASLHSKLSAMQENFRYIENTSNNFHAAISILQKSEIIGVCARDTSNGRRERACVIAFSTDNGVYLFDLNALGDKAFDRGLRGVLESESIVKVVYDCRFLSDCLYHQHNVTLTNVRDVEAEDIIIVHQERGGIRRHTRPFAYLVELYLGISGEIVNENNISDQWEDISSDPELQKFLATFVSLLIPVHKNIQEKYVKRLTDASKIYNEAVRTSDMYDYVFRDERYVSYKEMTELVNYKQSCRGRRLNM